MVKEIRSDETAEDASNSDSGYSSYAPEYVPFRDRESLRGRIEMSLLRGLNWGGGRVLAMTYSAFASEEGAYARVIGRESLVYQDRRSVYASGCATSRAGDYSS